MRIHDFFLPVFTLDVSVDELHGPRPVKGVHGNQVFDGIRFELLEVFAHSLRFKLEGADGLAPLVQLESSFIIQGDGIDIDLRTFTDTYIFDGILNDRQGFQAQEIHLQHANTFHQFALVLGHHKA